MGRGDRDSPQGTIGIAGAGRHHWRGSVLRNVIFAAPNRDARAAGEGIELASTHGVQLYERTGHWPMPIFTAARLTWLANNAPELFARAATVLSVSDWLAYRLSGEIASKQGPSAEPPPSGFRPRILVTAQMDEASLAGLRQLGEVEYANYREAMRLLTDNDLVEALEGYRVFITEVGVVDLEALQRSPDLRLIISCRENVVNVDVAACTALGPVLNVPGRNADAVADLSPAFMLMLGRKLTQANAFLRWPGGEAGDMGRIGQAYEELLGRELWGKTVGLVGLGAVGRAVARRLQPFEVRLLTHAPFIQAEEAELVSLEHLLEESDFVSLHAAVTDEARGLIGADELARMKPGAFLVNTARAALVDEEALLEHLRSGHLGGAALDVFSTEPPASDHLLLALPNVIATPHVGGNAIEVVAHQRQIGLEDLHRLLASREPLHALNPETLPGLSWEGARRPLDTAALDELAGRPGPAGSDLQQAREPVPPAKTGKVEAAAPDRDVSAQVEKVLRAFVNRAMEDPALIVFSARKKATTHYTLNDLGLEFYIGFQAGKVIGGLGAPPQEAEVRMKAGADTLDGIFSGRISGNKAAMSGKLSFQGDVRLAMGLQKVQRELVRLYTAAREEAGGLGDLSALEGKGLPASIATAPRAPGAPQDPLEELVQTVVEMFQMQLITATGGNVSVRLPGKDEAWITPSRLYKGNLRAEVMVRIDMEGNALDPDAPAPSSEYLMHTEIYKARPDVEAIIHAHAPYTTILGLSGRPFLPITTDAAFIKELPRVPFIMPGSRELAAAVVKALGKNPAAILQNHGVVVVASSLRATSNLVEAIERSSQLILGCYAVGKKPPSLPKSVVKMLQEIGEMMV